MQPRINKGSLYQNEKKKILLVPPTSRNEISYMLPYVALSYFLGNLNLLTEITLKLQSVSVNNRMVILSNILTIVLNIEIRNSVLVILRNPRVRNVATSKGVFPFLHFTK